VRLWVLNGGVVELAGVYFKTASMSAIGIYQHLRDCFCIADDPQPPRSPPLDSFRFADYRRRRLSISATPCMLSTFC